jgi:nitrate/TMAO reductase-like tetraheme cytochrome c subunit
MLPARVSRRAWVLASVATVAAALLVNFVTARSQFCGSCHSVMGEPYASWSRSSHSSVKCLDCHSDPGWVGYYHSKVEGVRNALKYFLGVDKGRRSAPPGPAACRRPGCHSDAGLLSGGGEGAAAHGRHLGSVACVECHGDVGHRVVAQRPTVVACDECHPAPYRDTSGADRAAAPQSP